MEENKIIVRIDLDSHVKVQERLAYAIGLLSGLRMSMDDFEDDQDVIKATITQLSEVQTILREGVMKRRKAEKTNLTNKKRTDKDVS